MSDAKEEMPPSVVFSPTLGSVEVKVVRFEKPSLEDRVWLSHSEDKLLYYNL